MPEAYETCAGMWRERASDPSGGRQYKSVYGIVSDPTAVSKTRGSDSKMTLKIYDETTSTKSVEYGNANDPDTIPSGVQITFFDQNPYELPRPAEGDVIRIHRLQAQMYNGRPQFIAKTGALLNMGHSKTSWCLFRGDDDSTEPYAQSSVNMSDVDEKRLGQLRKYAKKAKSMPFMNEYGFSGEHNKQRRICEIKQEEFFDLYCLILDAHFVENSDGAYVMMVWDGTDAPPLPPSMTTSLSDQRDELGMDAKDFQLHSELDKRQFYPRGFDSKGQEAIPDDEINQSIPLIGSAFPIFMHSSKVDYDEVPQPGEWVKIRNLNTQVVRGQLQGFVRRETAFVRNKAPLPALLQAYDLRKQQNVVAMWGASGHVKSCTVTQHPNIRYSTIREMLLSKPPNRHKLRAIVRGFSPDIVDMCQPVKGAKGKYEFTVCLRLVDATDCVDVYLDGEEAAKFFHNVTPSNMAKPSSDRERLIKMMKKLMTHESVEDSAPWIDVCVMQYIVRNAKAQTSKRVFQIFGTTIAQVS
jgi:hypothetical protein